MPFPGRSWSLPGELHLSVVGPIVSVADVTSPFPAPGSPALASRIRLLDLPSASPCRLRFLPRLVAPDFYLGPAVSVTAPAGCFCCPWAAASASYPGWLLRVPALVGCSFRAGVASGSRAGLACGPFARLLRLALAFVGGGQMRALL
ncbi:hypothetical protein Areg01_18670 [Actinoplanes regularis]|nr:hypothetical protein Areg01_18670 [Actinoplanes regularis]